MKNIATEWLGLTESQANYLFVPSGGPIMCSDPKVGAKVVRHLKNTGEVSWGLYYND